MGPGKKDGGESEQRTKENDRNAPLKNIIMPVSGCDSINKKLDRYNEKNKRSEDFSKPQL